MKQKRDERINFRNIGSQIKYLVRSFVLLNVPTHYTLSENNNNKGHVVDKTAYSL